MDDIKTIEQTEQPKKKTSGLKKFMRWFIILFLLVIGLLIYWKFFYTYSDGYRSGLLQKVSHRGNVIKTFEGELVMSSIASTNNVALASEKFYFSVPDDSVAKVLQSYEGKQVRLHYKQKNGHLFWRGDSEYLVDGIEPEVIK